MFLRWPDSKRRTCLKNLFPVRKKKLTGNSLILCTNYLSSICIDATLGHMKNLGVVIFGNLVHSVSWEFHFELSD